MSQGPLAVAINALVNSKSKPVAGGSGGELLIGQAHAALFESTISGRQMIGASQAGAALSVGLTAVYTGLCLSNPAGNTKNLVLTRASGLLEVAPTILTALGLITGWAVGGVTVHTTALVPQNAFLHDTADAPTAKLDAACTLVGTPVWSRWLKVTPSATGVCDFDADLQGAIVIPPGGYVAIGGSIAGPAAGFLGSFQWEEVDVAG